MGETKDRTIKELLFKNFTLIIGSLFTLANIILASVLAPIKQDLSALAQRMTKVEEVESQLNSGGSLPTKINTEKILNIEKDITEIKESQIRLESKVDRLLSK